MYYGYKINIGHIFHFFRIGGIDGFLELGAQAGHNVARGDAVAFDRDHGRSLGTLFAFEGYS